MKTAFSMIELIFIIIVMGILGSAIQMNIPDNRLLSDTNFIIQKIKQKQLYAISYDNVNYNNKNFTDNKTCININKSYINELETNATKAKPYKLSVKTTISPEDKIVCFDNLGRPYRGKMLNHFINMPILFNIKYKNKIKTVNIMPYSGNVIIKK